MEDMTIAELETAKAPIKDPVHQQKSREKKEEKPKQDKYTKRKAPEEIRAMGYTERMRYFDWCRDRDREKVKGIFRYFEMPGAYMEFVYRGHKGDPVEKYSMIDGQTYEIPVGVARHLNNDGWYPEYDFIAGGKTINVPGGKPTNMRISKKVHRFGFQKLDFMEDDDIGDVPTGLVGVEFVDKQNLVRPN